MKIRALKPSDFDDVVRAFYSYFPEAKDDPGFGLNLYRRRPGIEEEHKWFAEQLKQIRDGNRISLVAEVDSHVVGFCDVWRVRPGTPLDHRGTVGISVVKDHRGKGIGRALLVEAIARSRGTFELLELTVLTNNKRALKLYADLGFRRCGKLVRAMKRGGRYFDEYLMQLPLRD